MIDSEAVEAGGGHRMGQGWVSLQPLLSVKLCVWPPQEVKASVLLYELQWVWGMMWKQVFFKRYFFNSVG